MLVRPTLAPPPVAGLVSACRASSRGRTARRRVEVAVVDNVLRLFKFPQMDFEMAIWEMTSLLIAPKKVFKSIYYHVRWSSELCITLVNTLLMRLVFDIETSVLRYFTQALWIACL